MQFYIWYKKFLKNNYKKYDFFISSATPSHELYDIVKKKLSKYFINTLGSPNNKFQHIKYILKNYNYNNRELIFIGDTYNDYLAAKSYNIKFIAIRNKYEQFESFKYVIDNFYNFENYLKKILFMTYIKKNNLSVSFVMSIYNGEKYLDESIDSILSQTYNNFNLIIVDDASTDKTLLN